MAVVGRGVAYRPRAAGDAAKWPGHLDMDGEGTEAAVAEMCAATEREFAAIRALHRQHSKEVRAATAIQRIWRGALARMRYRALLDANAAELNAFCDGLSARLEKATQSSMPITVADMAALTPAQQRVVLLDIVGVDDDYLAECMRRLPAVRQLSAAAAAAAARRMSGSRSGRRRSSFGASGVPGMALLPRRAEAGRVALVVSNTRYADPALRRGPAAADPAGARGAAAALRERGFLTLLVEDAGLAAMRRATEAFHSICRSGAVAVLYYHGVVAHVAGEGHYLVPTDCPEGLGADGAVQELHPWDTVALNLSVARGLFPVVVLHACGRVGPADADVGLKGEGGPGELRICDKGVLPVEGFKEAYGHYIGADGKQHWKREWDGAPRAPMARRLCWGVAPADLAPPDGGYLVVPGGFGGEARVPGLLRARDAFGGAGPLSGLVGAVERHEGGDGGAFAALTDELRPAGVAAQRAEAGVAPHAGFAAAFADAVRRSQGPWAEALAEMVGSYAAPVHISHDADLSAPPLYLDNPEADDHAVADPAAAVAVAEEVGRCDAPGLAAIADIAERAIAGDPCM